MGYLAQTAADIAQVIENIDFITNKDILIFHSEEKILKTIKDTFSIVENVDIMPLLNEIWDKTTYPNRVSQAETLLSGKFKSLLNWKKDIDDFIGLQNALKDECSLFFNNYRSIGNMMSSASLNNLIIYYRQIGLRLLKLRLECKRLIEKIKQKAEEEEKEKDLLQGNYNKFILNPDKKSQFAAELSKLYRNGFFLAAAQDTDIREEDILFGFQKLLDVELLQEENSLTEIPDETYYEFEKFLHYSNKNLLARKIRETFTVEKGKAIRYLFEAMERNSPPLLIVLDGQKMALYEAFKKCMNRDIGSYNSIFQCNFSENDKTDQTQVEKFSVRLSHLI